MNWKRQFQTMLVSEELCRERFLIKVAPYSKLAVRSLSTSMARALKSARRPRKNKTNTASQFRDISPKKLY